jgi:hypothetical protein
MHTMTLDYKSKHQVIPPNRVRFVRHRYQGRCQGRNPSRRSRRGPCHGHVHPNRGHHLHPNRGHHLHPYHGHLHPYHGHRLHLYHGHPYHGQRRCCQPYSQGKQHRQKGIQQRRGNTDLPTRESGMASGMAAGIAAALMVMIARKPKITLKYFIVKVFLWALRCVCQ